MGKEVCLTHSSWPVTSQLLQGHNIQRIVCLFLSAFVFSRLFPPGQHLRRCGYFQSKLVSVAGAVGWNSNEKGQVIKLQQQQQQRASCCTAGCSYSPRLMWQCLAHAEPWLPTSRKAASLLLLLGLPSSLGKCLSFPSTPLSFGVKLAQLLMLVCMRGTQSWGVLNARLCSMTKFTPGWQDVVSQEQGFNITSWGLSSEMHLGVKAALTSRITDL